MCGIIAYLGRCSGSRHALEGIKILRNRGYDSVGCCSQQPDDQQIKITKFANRPDLDSFTLLEQNYDIHSESTCLVLHNRWATCGEVNDVNSHPHTDTLDQHICLLHNGIITNHDDLRNQLVKQGVSFQSETDTEVIVNLIAFNLKMDPDNNPDLMSAIQNTLDLLEGTWGLVIMNASEPNTLYVCKKGSPVLIAHSSSMCMVASEVSGFSNYLKNYFVVPDDLVVKIELNGNCVRRILHRYTTC